MKAQLTRCQTRSLYGQVKWFDTRRKLVCTTGNALTFMARRGLVKQSGYSGLTIGTLTDSGVSWLIRSTYVLATMPSLTVGLPKTEGA